MEKGTPSKELKDRNKLLYADYCSGKYSMVDLVKKYNITTQRIYKILEKFKDQNEN